MINHSIWFFTNFKKNSKMVKIISKIVIIKKIDIFKITKKNMKNKYY